MKILAPKSTGQSLLSIMGLFALLGGLMVGILNFTKILTKQRLQSTGTFQADVTRRNLLSVLNNSKAWNQTIALASNNRTSGSALDCLKDKTPCTTNGTDLSGGGVAISDYPIHVVSDAAGQTYYDTTSSSRGFTMEGAPCTSFVAPPAAGNDSCPLRFNVKWSAVCAGSCVNPQVKLSIEPIYNPGTNSSRKIAFNASNYGANVMRESANSALTNHLIGGRLTLVSGNPVADATLATTLYYTAYLHNQISLYSNSEWSTFSFTEPSLSLAGLASGTNYDIFAYDSSGTVTLEALAWAGNNARTTNLVRQDGVWVSGADASRRYLGTLRTSAAGKVTDDTAHRFLWNFYNRRHRSLYYTNGGQIGASAASAWHVPDGNAYVDCVVGIVDTTMTTYTTARIIGCGGVAVAPNIYLQGGSFTCGPPGVWHSTYWHVPAAPVNLGLTQLFFSVWAANAVMPISYYSLTLDYEG